MDISWHSEFAYTHSLSRDDTNPEKALMHLGWIKIHQPHFDRVSMLNMFGIKQLTNRQLDTLIRFEIASKDIALGLNDKI